MRRINIAASLAILFLTLAIVPALASVTVTDLHDFTGADGSRPNANVIQAADGILYGVASSGIGIDGAIFGIKTDGTGFSDVIGFGGGGGGGAPMAALVQGSDGKLYGTTAAAGANGDGTVFVFSEGGSGYTIHQFAGEPSDGASPEGLILGADGYFYGITSGGGANNAGTIFRISADGSTYSVIHSFDGTTSSAPEGTLVQAPDGTLYGTTIWTVNDDTSTDGVVYKINTDGSGFSILHTFNGGTTDGANPFAGLIIGDDRYLYGTAPGGGANSDGIVYKIATDGSNFAILHSFNGTDGSFPNAALTIGNDGKLYGTTANGGTNGNGSLFEIAPDGSSFTSLYSFSSGGTIDGSDIQAGLTAGTDGNFYGTAFLGGANGDGTVFQLSAGLPASPTYLSFVAGPEQLALSWNTFAGATSYNVYRGTSPGQESATAIATGLTSPTFTDTGLTIGTTYYYKVSAVVSSAETAKSAEASATPLTPPTLHTFAAGLQMISAPTNDGSDTVAEIFGDSTAKLAVWTAGAYTVTPTFPANWMLPCHGYWVKPTSTATLYDIGTDDTNSSTYQIALSAGWNMIGDPFTISVPATDLQVQNGSNPAVSFATANTDGLVADTFYTYQVGDTAYEVLPASSSSLTAYKGYWLYAFAPCTLIFPAGG